AASEMTGPSFDPTGTRLYFSSQRAGVSGVTYEITGPWRARPARTIRPQPQKVRLGTRRRIGRKRLGAKGLPVSIRIDTKSSVVLELRARTRKGKRVLVGRA